MEMWSMPRTLDVGRDLGRAMRRSSETEAGFLWSQRPGWRIVSRPSKDGQAGGETMGSMSKTLGALALASGALFAGDALAGTLDQIRDTKTMRMTYDPEDPPCPYTVPRAPTLP